MGISYACINAALRGMEEYHFNILHALHFVDGDIINISVIDGRFVQSLDLDSGLHSKIDHTCNSTFM